MMNKLIEYITKLENDSFKGWSRDAISGYETACFSIKEKAKALNRPNPMSELMDKYSLETDFEEKVARMIDLKLKIRRTGELDENEYLELDELQDWFIWGKWRDKPNK